jgi:hypothetical protein
VADAGTTIMASWFRSKVGHVALLEQNWLEVRGSCIVGINGADVAPEGLLGS